MRKRDISHINKEMVPSGRTAATQNSTKALQRSIQAIKRSEVLRVRQGTEDQWRVTNRQCEIRFLLVDETPSRLHCQRLASTVAEFGL